MDHHPDLSDEQKETVKANSTLDGVLRCAFGKEPISDGSQIEYHHLDPFMPEVDIDINNFAVVCKKHHKKLGALSINEYKVSSSMEDFFKDPNDRRLDDLLRLKGRENGSDIDYLLDSDNKKVNLSYYGKNELVTSSFDLNTCPATGFRYFFAVLPFSIIQNDNELQPRPLEFKRLFAIYRHLMISPQLTPSVCRIEKNKILLFDGQHKAAAQIWAGRSSLECKVYLEPDTRVLKEANLIAHDKLRQMPFFTSVLINKWADLFGGEWGEYLESGGEKSEKGFVDFLVNKGRKRTEAVNMLESNIFDSLLEDNSNKLMAYVSIPSIMEKRPITINKLKQSILKRFVTKPPLSIGLDRSDLLREFERKNIIRFLNIIAIKTIEGKWDPDNPKNESERIYLNGALRGWSSMLRDIIATILELFDESDKKKIMLRKVSEEQWEKIANVAENLFEHRIWSDDSEDNYHNLRTGSEDKVKEYFRRKGITVNSLLDKASGEPDFID